MYHCVKQVVIYDVPFDPCNAYDGLFNAFDGTYSEYDGIPTPYDSNGTG